MTLRNDEIWDVLGRYFDQSMSRRDEIILEQWLKKDKENRQTLEFMEELRASGEDGRDQLFFSKLNADEDWSSVAAHIRKERAKEKQKKIYVLKQKKKKKEYAFSNLLKVASLLLVALTSGYLTWEFVYNPALEAEIQEMAVLEEVSTNRGERANITLGDGTSVSLSVDSKLLIPKQFGDDQRRVILEGEAFFDVTEDPSRPFLIESHGSVTEVLGTSFGVRSYQGDSKVQVVVKSGTVALRKMTQDDEEASNRDTWGANSAENGQRVVLQAGEIGIFKKDDYSLSSGIAEDTDDFLGWMENRLVFREAPLEEIIETLERWFDVTIISELSDREMSESRITLNVRKGHIQEVLDLISISADISYEFLNGENIILKKQA